MVMRRWSRELAFVATQPYSVRLSKRHPGQLIEQLVDFFAACVEDIRWFSASKFDPGGIIASGLIILDAADEIMADSWKKFIEVRLPVLLSDDFPLAIEEIIREHRVLVRVLIDQLTFGL